MNNWKKECFKAEERASKNFELIMKIEKILEDADKSKEMYYQTINKIKRAIYLR